MQNVKTGHMALSAYFIPFSHKSVNVKSNTFAFLSCFCFVCCCWFCLLVLSFVLFLHTKHPLLINLRVWNCCGLRRQGHTFTLIEVTMELVFWSKIAPSLFLVTPLNILWVFLSIPPPPTPPRSPLVGFFKHMCVSARAGVHARARACLQHETVLVHLGSIRYLAQKLHQMTGNCSSQSGNRKSP